jgi:hypothetical protein
MKNNAIEINANIVWACAAAADRINNGYYKADYIAHEGRKIFEIIGNKKLIRGLLDLYQQGSLAKSKVTDADHAKGLEVRLYWQSQMLLLLDNTVNGYLKGIVSAAHLDTIDIETNLHLAIIGSSFQAFRRNNTKQTVAEVKQKLDSKHYGRIGTSFEISGDVDILQVNYVEQFGAHAVDAVVNGNLYSWWSRNVAPSIGKYASIKGRIKAHAQDYDTGQPCTKINYVKITL